ncbi:hypothetical protein BDN70DRAFT_889184 [Pholiota conissans]|uniref:Uncharacterized protein n=1 Tax=Pholiota conissans TaxID=109636 RepID=A0A9P5YLZ2_9AGAR|nr:hypothetical protein BDN70DRAFT_889184 [Pholiota conissans]
MPPSTVPSSRFRSYTLTPPLASFIGSSLYIRPSSLHHGHPPLGVVHLSLFASIFASSSAPIYPSSLRRHHLSSAHCRHTVVVVHSPVAVVFPSVRTHCILP